MKFVYVKINEEHVSLFRDINFVLSYTIATRATDPLKLNNAINACLKNLNIFVNIHNITNIASIITNRKS